MEKTCGNPTCGKTFAPKRNGYAKFCSDACRSVVRHQNDRQKKLNGTPQLFTTHTPPPKPSMVVKEEIKLPYAQLPPDAQFIIIELTRQRDKLETELKEKVTELKDLVKEKTELEKEVETVQRELSAKPSALQGFFSEPSKVMEMVQHVPQVFQGIAEMIRAGKESTQQAQIAGAPEGNQVHPIMAWLGTQPEDVQTSILSMIDVFKTMHPHKIVEVIAYTNRNSMAVKRKIV